MTGNNFFNVAGIYRYILLLVAVVSAGPSGSLTSNVINDIYIAGDTVWIATDKGVNYTWDNGKSWKGFTSEHGLGNGMAESIIHGDGKTFVSTYMEGSDFILGTGISEYNYKTEKWSNKRFKWRNKATINDTAMYKLGYNVAVFDSTVYFAYVYGSVLKYSIRADTGWQIIVPDTTGLLPEDYAFSDFPPDTIMSTDTLSSGEDTLIVPVFPSEFIVWAIGIDSISPDSFHVFLGTANGLMMSRDKGTSWKHLLPPKNTGRSASGLWCQKVSTVSVLWVNFESNGDNKISNQKTRTLRSFDNGETWKELDTLGGLILNDVAFTGNSAWIATDLGLFEFVGDSLYKEPESFRTNGLITRKCRTIDALIDTANKDTVLWMGTGKGLYRSGNAGKDWQEFRLYPRLDGNLRRVYAVPNLLSFGQEPVEIAYKLSQSARTTIEIYNWNMCLVKTIIKDQQRNSGNEQVSGRSTDPRYDYWDGTNNRGAKVPMGTYYIKIKTDKGEKGFGKIIVAR